MKCRVRHRTSLLNQSISMLVKLLWTTLDHSKLMLSTYSRIISVLSLMQPPTRLILVGRPSRGLEASQPVQECLGLVMVAREVTDIGLDVGIVQVVQLQVGKRIRFVGLKAEISMGLVIALICVIRLLRYNVLATDHVLLKVYLTPKTKTIKLILWRN